MLLSVVIPFYQVEAYLPACLERVVRLPVKECEVLLVDDCGVDASAQIAQDYAYRYANFRVIRRAHNGGLSAARNTGLREAQGQYVYFLDSDDLLVPDALMHMAERAKRENLDVVKARFVYFDDETGEETPGPALTHTGCERGAAMFARQCAENSYEPMVWQCIYRREFLLANGLEMAEGVLFEDELFQAPALLRAKRTAVEDRVLLLYRQRAGSIMKSFAKSARWCGSYLEVCRRLGALAAKTQDAPAARALKKRVGCIALSAAKNIPAYRLPEDVAEEALGFVRAHRRELAGYALRSGSPVVMAQGLLLLISVRGFVACYARF